MLVAILAGEEKPDSIFQDRPADRPSEMLPVKGGLGAGTIFDCGAPLEVLVANEDEQGGVKVVGPRFGDDIDDAGPGAANLSRVMIRGQLKFSYGVLGEVHQGPAHDGVVVTTTINGEIAGTT